MEICFNPTTELEFALRSAARIHSRFNDEFEPRIRPAEARHGDFQSNGILPWAKRNGHNPRETAQLLVDTLQEQRLLPPEVVSVEIAGPGFINFRLSLSFLIQWLRKYRSKDDFIVSAGAIYQGKRIIVDYPSPNCIKDMHVAHIRAMVIGEAIRRLLVFCGAEVTSDNHLGDWGTQYGILFLAIRRYGYDFNRAQDHALADFEALYRKGTELFKAEESARVQAREELLLLQRGDPERMHQWEKIMDLSEAACREVYEILDLHLDTTLGESFYRDKVDQVYGELLENHIAQKSEGALVVFHPDHPRFKDQPLIVRKSNGASNYASHDLATILYRIEHFQAEEIIYLTDIRQKDHFEQLFLTAARWLPATGRSVPAMHHIWFGTIVSEDGKAITTRSGDPVKLKDLLAEAVVRARQIVAEKNPELSDEEMESIARVVGIGAVRYADLMQNRTSDYVFSWEKTLSLKGNTAPYLLYAVARIYSIFARAGLEPGDAEDNPSPFETKTEIALARKMIAFVAVINQTVTDLRPHFLCSYLYELAGTFSSFYDRDRVMVDDPGVRARRLILCARTLLVLESGLHLLGLQTLKRM